MTVSGLTYRLSLVFVATVPWELMVESSGIGTLSKFVGMAAMGLWLLGLVTGAGQRRLTAPHAAVAAFVVWAGFTAFWSLDPAESFGGVVTNVQLLGMSILIWSVFDDTRRVHAALQAYVVGCFVMIGGVLHSFVNNQTTVYLRYAAPGADVDNTALIIALGIPAAFYLALTPRDHGHRTLYRAVNIAFVPLALFGMVLTGTRGALLAVLPTLIVMLVVLGRSGTAGRLVAIADFAPSALVDRVTSSNPDAEIGGDGAILTGRAQIWVESLQAFAAHPIGGVGDNAHRAAIPTHKVAHNTLLSVLTETGVVGLLLLLLALWFVVRLVRPVLFEDNWYWFTQLLLIAIGSVSLSTEDMKSMWIIVSLAVSFAARRKTATASVPAPARLPAGARAAVGLGGSARRAGIGGTALPRA